VSISGLVHVGDFIHLSSGEEGYVADITWRCTTMRTLANNMVVIPNSKLGQTIFTNYHLPDARMAVSITMNVGCDSDIAQVEALLLDETMACAESVPGVLADPAPNVRFAPGPGDWSLGFQVNVQIARHSDHLLALSELRKRLFIRLRKEGISMPYPTRTVILEQAPGA
jgi:small-conductance mechanosensitive channel